MHANECIMHERNERKFDSVEMEIFVRIETLGPQRVWE